MVSRGERDLEAAMAARDGLGDADALEAEITPALEASRSAEASWGTAIARLADADAALLEAEERLSAARASDADRLAAVARATERRAAAAERVARLERELAHARSVVAAASEAAATADEVDARERAGLERAREVLRTAEVAAATSTSSADEARQRAGELDGRASTLAAELSALEERAAHGERLAPRLVASGWRGLLEALDPPREAWAALEAVVGGDLADALLWDGADPAGMASGSGGVARLLATGTSDEEARAAAFSAVGGDRTLGDLLARDDLPLALRRVVVAPSLERLVDGWRSLPNGWIAVTLHGDLADARGVVTVRGRDDAHAGEAARLHARRRDLAAELERLRVTRDEADAAATAAQALRTTHRESLIAVREEADAAERRQRTSGASLASATAAEDRARAEEARLADALRAAREQAAHEAAQQVVEAPGGSAIEALADAAAEARRHRDEAAGARDAARDAWQAARGAAEAAEARSAGRRGERAMAEARIAALEAAIPSQRSALETLTAERAILHTALEAARASDAQAAAAQRSADEEREARRRELLELERGTGDAVARLAHLERAAQSTAIDASRAEDALAAAARERELALEGIPETGGDEQAPAEDLAALDDPALEADLRRVRRTLGQIGSVNPFAIEEHRELAERLDGLSGQEADLGAAIGSTEELIATLDGEINERFNVAFAQIATRFDEFCQLLFAGGSGSLQLSDGEEGEAPGGIEIVVRPPGKRLQRLAMLSGGERALTGVALLFAMLSVNPVPFCILDEVDAALDEANIGRFADALRKLSEAIDFVVITHNRATIEVADTIYGVTMTDAAVSRVLSLRLADLPAEVGA
jgi:chromosome segregation protein